MPISLSELCSKYYQKGLYLGETKKFTVKWTSLSDWDFSFTASWNSSAMQYNGWKTLILLFFFVLLIRSSLRNHSSFPLVGNYAVRTYTQLHSVQLKRYSQFLRLYIQLMQYVKTFSKCKSLRKRHYNERRNLKYTWNAFSLESIWFKLLEDKNT